MSRRRLVTPEQFEACRQPWASAVDVRTFRIYRDAQNAHIPVRREFRISDKSGISIGQVDVYVFVMFTDGWLARLVTPDGYFVYESKKFKTRNGINGWVERLQLPQEALPNVA